MREGEREREREGGRGRERERGRERCTLADEVWEELLTGKIQEMDSLELHDIKSKINLSSNTL